MRLIVHLVGRFIEYMKMYGTTNPEEHVCSFTGHLTLLSTIKSDLAYQIK
jgi:hypothetical protein